LRADAGSHRALVAALREARECEFGGSRSDLCMPAAFPADLTGRQALDAFRLDGTLGSFELRAAHDKFA
jgi:hypothetical protein